MHCHKAEVNLTTMSIGDMTIFKIVAFVCLSIFTYHVTKNFLSHAIM